MPTELPEIWLPHTREVKEDYNEIQVSDGDDVRQAKLEMWIAKTLCEELNKHYPMRDWLAGVDLVGGVVIIQQPDISTRKGYVISLKRSLNEIRKMMRAVGGEILERAGLPTGKKFNPDLMEVLPRAINDEVLAVDLLAPEEKRGSSN